MKIPENLSKHSEKIRIVFCGQYGSGKSSIIRYLNGDTSIKVGD
jgi:GTPase SAR1 family protein